VNINQMLTDAKPEAFSNFGFAIRTK